MSTILPQNGGIYNRKGQKYDGALPRRFSFIPVAKIGETSYTSLTAAVNAVNTDDTITVTVLTGSSLDETVIIDKDITLDLGD